jgi:hypothetical protein
MEHDEEGVPSTAIREFSLLQQLDHPNIVKLKSIDLDETKLNLVFEFVQRDIKKYLEHIGGPMPEQQCKVTSEFNIHRPPCIKFCSE